MSNRWALFVRTSLLPLVAAGLMVVAPTAWAGPTYADQQEFIEEVHGYGILQNFPAIVLGDELLNICRIAIEYPQVGLTVNDAVNVFANAYGLSIRDAKWFVRTGLDYCD
jgi:hypothetical protein